MNRFDVIVIGAGITGLSSAYHLKRENRDLRIAIVERAGTYAQGNTARATAGFRDLFSTDMNFKLSHSTIDFYSELQKSGKADLGMIFAGYMLLLEEGSLQDPFFESIMKKTESRMVDADELESSGYFNLNPDSDEARMINAHRIGGAFLGLNCGIIEPNLVADFYYSELVRMGVEFHFGTTVLNIPLVPVKPLDYPGEPFLWQEKKIGAIMTSKGEMSGEMYVLSTDVWTTSLLDPVGIDSHIRPKKRQVFQVAGPDIENMLTDGSFNGKGVFPFTILPGEGIHIRPAPKEKTFRVSVADEIGRDFSFSEEPEIEKSFFNYSIRPVLHEYLPPFRNSRLVGGWAGHYSYNTIDMHPYIFKTLNIIVATGTSGSGIMKADANGRVVSAVYSGRDKVALHDGSEIRSSDLGILERNVGRENFVI